jgi:hypothetical protein
VVRVDGGAAVRGYCTSAPRAGMLAW